MVRYNEDEDVLDAEQQTEYRSLLGAYMYLMNSRVDCLYSQSHHGRHSHEPTTSDMNLLRGTCVFAAQTAECGLYYPSRSAIMAGHRPGFENLGSGQKADYHNDRGMPKGQQWECYVDTSFREKGCQTGVLILLNGKVVDMRSSSQKVQARSTTKAELNALYEMIDTLMGNQWTWKELLMEINVNVNTNIYCDSLNVVDALNKDHPHYNEHATRMYINKIRRLIERCIMEEPAGTNALTLLPEMSAQAREAMDRNIKREISSAAPLLIAVHDELRAYRLSPLTVMHIPGELNMADHLTKPTHVHKAFLNNILFNSKELGLKAPDVAKST